MFKHFSHILLTFEIASEGEQLTTNHKINLVNILFPLVFSTVFYHQTRAIRPSTPSIY